MKSITENRITHKIIAVAILENTSPLLMGKGKGDEADKVIMLDEKENPYIPASAFVGAIRSHFINEFDIPVHSSTGGSWNDDYFRYWGGSYTVKENGKEIEKSSQSHLAIDNLYLIEGIPQNISIRDGVEIDYITNIVKEKDKNGKKSGGKYDYQLLEPGAKFKLHLELTIRKGFNESIQKQLLNYIISGLEHDKFRFGAHTSFGFGKVETSKLKVYDYNFGEDGNMDVFNNWKKYLEADKNTFDFAGENDICKSLPEFKSELLKPENSFSIKADFKIKSSLITGGVGPSDSNSDKTNLHSYRNSESVPVRSELVPVLSGKSIKGALRSRAGKIVNTIGGTPEKIVDPLFGFVYKKGKVDEKKNNAQKSRLLIEEVVMKNAGKPIMQDRVKIDRFRGGASDGAKFDSEPLWRNANETFQIKLSIKNYKKEEAGLMLHLLKDLWTSDLAIGGEKNVGRGVLEGVKADISFENTFICIEKSEAILKITGKEKDKDKELDAIKKLEEFASAFNKI